MKRYVLAIGFISISIASTFAQKYFCKTGNIAFYSHTPIEDIAAESQSASTVYDASTGKLQWAVLIKSFNFEKALMQEHFNENYMESSKYPKASFKGEIVNFEAIDLSSDGSHNAQIRGKLTIHGVTKEVETRATFEVKNGAVKGESKFNVLVADYGIEIPSVVKENIAKEIEITVKADYAILDRS